jgi:hypothetical protein
MKARWVNGLFKDSTLTCTSHNKEATCQLYEDNCESTATILPNELTTMILIESIFLTNSSERIGWISCLRLVCKKFLWIINEPSIKRTIGEIIEFDSLLFENAASAACFKGCWKENLPVCGWLYDGSWEGFFSKPVTYLPLDKRRLVELYRNFKLDMLPILKEDFTKWVGAKSFDNKMFFIRKANFETKENLDDEALLTSPKRLKCNEDRKQFDNYAKDSRSFWEHFLHLGTTLSIDPLEKPDALYETRSQEENSTFLDSLKNLQQIFENHFPGRNYQVYYNNAQRDWEAYFFFVGELPDCYLGMWFFAQQQS